MNKPVIVDGIPALLLGSFRDLAQCDEIARNTDQAHEPERDERSSNSFIERRLDLSILASSARHLGSPLQSTREEKNTIHAHVSNITSGFKRIVPCGIQISSRYSRGITKISVEIYECSIARSSHLLTEC